MVSGDNVTSVQWEFRSSGKSGKEKNTPGGAYLAGNEDPPRRYCD